MIDDKQEPAFPQNPETMRWADQQGMSLRDYFAAKAMQGICANVNDDHDSTIETYEEYVAENARCAYLLADAMLEARK